MLPGVAASHPGHDAGAGFMAGALHPVTGLDHLVVLLAMGALAARMRGVAAAAVPLAFLGMLSVGIACGLRGIEVPCGEALIAVSVLVTAAAALWPPGSLPAITVGLAGVFAFFHGSAHGLEGAAGMAHLQYAAGLLSSSAAALCAAWLLVRMATTRPVPVRR
jgi:urease accessory protein